jgi:hypothetical protein
MNVVEGMEPVPEQDIRFGDPEAPPTSWADTRRVLETAELFWSPQFVPMAGLTSPHSRRFGTTTAFTSARATGAKGREYRPEPRVALTTRCNLWKEGLDLVVEGTAVRITDASRLHRLAPRGWRFCCRLRRRSSEGACLLQGSVRADSISLLAVRVISASHDLTSA